LNSCQYLENINVWCGSQFLIEKDALEMMAIYSPENVCELNLIYLRYLKPKLSSEEFEYFLISWANRLPLKPLSLIISDRYHVKSRDSIAKNAEIANKYIKLGIIKKYRIN